MPTRRAGRGWWGPVPLYSVLCFPSAATSAVVPIPGTFSWPLAARGKPRRGMLRRAVFSDVQRKALEKMFQKQKYISKPDRKKLAAKLGLKDSQVREALGGEGRSGAGSWALHPWGQLERRGQEQGELPMTRRKSKASYRAMSIHGAKKAAQFPAGQVGQDRPRPYWPPAPLLGSSKTRFCGSC